MDPRKDESMEPQSAQDVSKALARNPKGLSISQLMEITKLSRITITTALERYMKIGRVHEEAYGNVNVYFLNGVGEYQKRIAMDMNGELFVDVFTNPWGKPFIRVKQRRNGKDMGAIIVDKRSITELTETLEKMSPKIDVLAEHVKCTMDEN